ncbi:conserved hypothetical protein [Verticillium alfalfae VaMs.102]|uniref:Uncharacterized protein n=1 Tax=Verticillium alfalfae (strain VaMs.102 / ATCC MYA-4576 / FGSC 10136) TaxID=526221 RepID=C9SU84_VERA1|nr:conserved hypothetical protein [Verticillium alfalfae VaMs.102]EEY22395.1 conserved hypothetical protein [Verticillium alfalfae VaMs.102]
MSDPVNNDYSQTAYSSSWASKPANVQRSLPSTVVSQVREYGILPDRPVRSNIYAGLGSSASIRPPILCTLIATGGKRTGLLLVQRHASRPGQRRPRPHNILLNWASDEQNTKTATDAVPGDFNVARKLAPSSSRQTPHATGNIMWWSPEGQKGRGVTKASDICLFGLCTYVHGGGDLLFLNGYEALDATGITPKHEILAGHLAYFGPAPPRLLEQVRHETSCEALKRASRIAEISLRDQPSLSVEYGGNELGPRGKDMSSRMTNPDPAVRLAIDQILAYPLWENGG